jgi:hypothetical protein
MAYRSIFIPLILLAAAPAIALDVSVAVTGSAICGQPLGGLSANANGGVPPYTFLWDNGVVTAYNMGLPAGTYSVTVTDAVGTVVVGQGTVTGLSSYPFSTFEGGAYCNAMQPWVLFYAGTVNGMPPDPMSGSQHGPGPYTFSAPGYQVSYGEWPEGCGGMYSYYSVGVDAPPGTGITMNYTDGAGCPGSFGFTVPPPITFPAMQVVNVSGSCSNGAIGSATVSIGATPSQQDFRVRLKNAAHQVVQGACGEAIHGITAATQAYSGLAPGTYWVVADVDKYGLRNDIQVDCSDSISFVIPDLGTTCGLVSGRIYIDNNTNCTYNSGENNVPGTIIEITPGPHYAATNSSGNYSVSLPYGTYQFTAQGTAVQQSCPLQVTVASASLSGRNIGCAGGMPLDARVLMANGAARPGFELLYAIDVDNLTTASTGAATLTVEADPALQFLNASPQASSVAGSTYTWNLSMTNVFQHREVRLRMRVPPDVGLIGSMVNTVATLATANTDADLANNTAISQQLITGSFDPNDKAVRTTTGQEGIFVTGEDEWLDYTIRFQNTGNDTAFNVVITDTLPATLDPATIQWGPASHACTRTIGADGTLKFIFANILLPDSNANEPKSHGLVSFRIGPHEGLVPGTLIENVANIYFDFNPPVITEPSVLEVVPPPLRVAVRAALGGAYDAGNGLMRDELRGAGLLPGLEPYTALGYVHAGAGGGEMLPPLRLGALGDTAVVDWVVLELRDQAAPAMVLHSVSALLQRDGTVVDVRGGVPWVAAPYGDYYVALRHRNHLGVMTAGPVALGPAPTVVDFTDPGTDTWGTDARMAIGGVRLLWPGDAIRDGRLKYTGAANDRDFILQATGGELPTATVEGYQAGDVNMDGTVKYTGTANDRDVILQVIGSEMPTAVRQEQLPQ